MGFRGDERGQSEVIGALLIFAVIVAFIGLNQAFLVPQANEEIEFKHSNDVQRDVVDLRAATTEAAASNQPRSRTVELGTDYPSRFVAINPPPATGTIRTEGGGEIIADQDNFDLSTVCGTGSEPPDTKFLTYQPNYNEYGNALPMTIENTMAYRDTGSRKLYSTGQVFLKGNQINVIRYVGDVQETSKGSASLDLIPSETGSDTINTSRDTLEITLPTRLEADDWDELVDSSSVSIEDVEKENKVKFTFDDGSNYKIRCTTVGINEEPDVNPRTLDLGDDTEGEFNEINPAGEGSILLHSVSEVGASSNDSNVSIILENNSFATETVTMNRARLNYFSGTSPGTSPESGITHVKFPQSGDTRFVAGGEIKDLDDSIEINKGKTEIYLKFDGEVENDDFYVLTVKYSDGNIHTYFISHPSESGS